MQWRKIKQDRGQWVWWVGKGWSCKFKHGGQKAHWKRPMEQRLRGEEVSHLDVWEELVKGSGWGSESYLFKAEQGQSNWVAVVAERAGEDKAKEARRLTVQSHCNDLGFSEMGSAMWGLEQRPHMTGSVAYRMLLLAVLRTNCRKNKWRSRKSVRRLWQQPRQEMVNAWTMMTEMAVKRSGWF